MMVFLNRYGFPHFEKLFFDCLEIVWNNGLCRSKKAVNFFRFFGSNSIVDKKSKLKRWKKIKSGQSKFCPDLINYILLISQRKLFGNFFTFHQAINSL